jgi:ribosomal protein S18 acetylase RimI-like enzyme
VARERRYLATVELVHPREATVDFVRNIMAGNGSSFVALDNGELVGWCDVVRRPSEGYRHTGVLGMGVLAQYRGQGLGRRLLDATIGAARDIGISRVELEVFASNAVAVALYRKAGFTQEGVKRGARILDAETDDIVCMALFV